MKRGIAIAAALVVAAVGVALVKLNAMASVASGYFAKVACSEIFLAGRTAPDVVSGDFRDINPVFSKLSIDIDDGARQVRASLFGLGRASAQHREGYGCTLRRGGPPAALATIAPVTDKPLPEALAGTPAMRDDIDYAAIDAALAAAFNDEIAATRAILVVKDGAVIAERYAPGFTAATPFLSWSMAKSVTASMVGAAVLKGAIAIDQPAPAIEWRTPADPRFAITWNDLLQMQSGLAFSEVYEDPNSDVSRMLFRARDAGGAAAKEKLIHEPGAFWDYSSGTTNLIQRTLRQALEADGAFYHSFARDTLFAPLGAASFRLEPDSSGTFIGSSFIYATARDWAKLGLLYLNDGVVDGERLLPEGWSRYVATPAAASDSAYGAHFWLNRPGAEGRAKYFPGVPDDAYMMAGHEGQYVLIVPGDNLVIVRTGLTRAAEAAPRVAPTFAAIVAAVR